jgi:hypothetical protein
MALLVLPGRQSPPRLLKEVQGFPQDLPASRRCLVSTRSVEACPLHAPESKTLTLIQRSGPQVTPRRRD